MQIWRARPGWPNRADEDAAIRHMRRRRRDLLTPGFQAVAQLPVVERPQVHCTCACPRSRVRATERRSTSDGSHRKYVRKKVFISRQQSGK